MRLKSSLYKIIRIWNAIDAIRKGSFGKSIGRRVVRRAANKGIRRLFK